VATGWTMARRCSEDHCRRRRTGHEWKRRRSGRTGGARKASALGIAARFSRRLCRFQSRHIPKDCCGRLNPIATSRGIATEGTPRASAGGGCDFSAFKVRRLLIFLATKAPLRSPLGARCFLRKRSATNRFRLETSRDHLRRPVDILQSQLCPPASGKYRRSARRLGY
jgi:hypothetical protein